MRKTRRRFRQRIAIGAAATLVLAAVATGPAGSLIGRLRAASSLEDLLSGRSPGERTGGELVKLKRPRAHGRGGPEERVEPLLRTRPGGPFADESPLAGAALGPEVPADSLPFAFDTPDVGNLVPASGGGGNVPFIPLGTPVIFGPTAEESPTPEPSPVPTTPVPGPVPEPATWLTMILGFGVIGAASRRTRSAAKFVTVRQPL